VAAGRRFRQCGDEQARDALVQRWMPLARRLARGFHRGREPLEDLEQVAFIGLLKAIDRFEADRGAASKRVSVSTHGTRGSDSAETRRPTTMFRFPHAAAGPPSSGSCVSAANLAEVYRSQHAEQKSRPRCATYPVALRSISAESGGAAA